MTDSWNDKPGKSPHDSAMNYRTVQIAEKETDYSDNGKLYQLGLDALESHNLYLERSLTGSHAGHNVYLKAAPRPIAGITVPTWFKAKRLIQSEHEEAEVTRVLTQHASLATEAQQFWSPLYQPNSGQRGSALLGHVERLLRIDENRWIQNENLPFELGIQVDSFAKQQCATEQPRAFVPPREWFSEEVQQLDFGDIFTIWPKAELEMLKLIIGRALVGRSGSKLVGSGRVIEHTYRTVGIIVGEPGLGKSTLFNKLFRALNAVGYTRYNFRDVTERFGLANLVLSDFGYKDDVSVQTLSHMISSENLKIIASGGQLMVEDKFMSSRNVFCHSVVLCCTNDWDPRAVYRIDSGIASRVKLLSTVSRQELHQRHMAYAKDGHWAADAPDLVPFMYLPWLASRLAVSEDCLMLWACRLAVDEFLKFCYTKGDIPTEALRHRTHILTSALQCQFNKDSARTLISGMALAEILLRHIQVAWNVGKPFVMKELNEKPLADMLASYRRLVCDARFYRVRSLLKAHWELNDRPESHPWTGMRNLNQASLIAACNTLNNAITAKQPLDRLVKETFSELTLRSGFKGSSDIIWVTKSWTDVAGDVANLYALATAINSTFASEQMAECLRALGQSVPEESWVLSPEFSPKSVDEQLATYSRGFAIEEFLPTLLEAKWKA